MGENKFSTHKKIEKKNKIKTYRSFFMEKVNELFSNYIITVLPDDDTMSAVSHPTLTVEYVCRTQVFPAPLFFCEIPFLIVVEGRLRV